MGGYVTPTYYCKVCKQIKVWYKFKYGVDESSAICFDCNKKGIDTNEMADRFRLQYRLKKIISAAMKNRMYDLRNHLFETL